MSHFTELILICITKTNLHQLATKFMSEIRKLSQTTFWLTFKEIFLLRGWALKSFAGMFICSTASIKPYYVLQTENTVVKRQHFPPWSSHSREGDKWSYDTNFVSHDKCYGETQSRVKIQRFVGCCFSQGTRKVLWGDDISSKTRERWGNQPY